MRFFHFIAFLIFFQISYAQLPVNEDHFFESCNEKEPEYPGGKYEVQRLLMDSFLIPSIFDCQYFEATIIVVYCIDTFGHLQSLLIEKGFHPELDKEVLRMMKLLKQWNPGERGGKKTVYWRRQPFYFNFSINEML